jgi:hypothetical protein
LGVSVGKVARQAFRRSACDLHRLRYFVYIVDMSLT